LSGTILNGFQEGRFIKLSFKFIANLAFSKIFWTAMNLDEL
jgi:hypothetical protein